MWYMLVNIPYMEHMGYNSAGLIVQRRDSIFTFADCWDEDLWADRRQCIDLILWDVCLIEAPRI